MSTFGQIRLPNASARGRRNSQAWQSQTNIVDPNGGIVIDPATGSLSVQVSSPLAIVANSIALSIGSGLETLTDTLVINLATNPGLVLTGGELLVDLDTNSGLQLLAGGISIQLATNPGLVLSAGGIAVDLDGASLSLGASGLSVSAPGGQVGVTSVQTGVYSAAIDELVRYDASGGTFTITTPSATGIAGRSVEFKESVGDTTGVTLDPPGAQTIDGAATLSVGTTGREYTRLTSDGTNWMNTT